MCDFSNAYILAKGTIAVTNTAAQGAGSNAASKKVIFKKCAPFINCMSRINNLQEDDAHDIDVVMPLYNLMEYSDNYSKTSGILWQYCRAKPALDANGAIIDFTVANSISDTFKIKEKITSETDNDDTKMLK